MKKKTNECVNKTVHPRPRPKHFQKRSIGLTIDESPKSCMGNTSAGNNNIHGA